VAGHILQISARAQIFRSRLASVFKDFKGYFLAFPKIRETGLLYRRAMNKNLPAGFSSYKPVSF
jgi:hypothetical protein